MRFAIATADCYLGVFEAFVNAGWQPVTLFSMPIANAIDNHMAVCAFAEKHRAAIQLSRITERDMRVLQEQGCEALIVACHAWRIGDWRPYLKYAVNFHCSPLPEGRGPYPLHRAILENRKTWAVTCHRLAPEFDTGDILAAESFSLEPDECHESLSLKVQMSGKKLAARIAENFLALWDQATPQQDGSYWPKNTIADRVVNFQSPVESVMRHIRAFGATESLAKVDNTWLVIRRAVGWPEMHNHSPGKVVHVHNRTVVVAALDGFISLFEPETVRPEIVSIIQKQ